MINSDPAQAQTLLQRAWDDMQRAGGRRAAGPARPGSVARHGRHSRQLFGTARVAGTQFYAAPAGCDRSRTWCMGPDKAAYAIVGDGVVRVDPTTGAVATVVQSGAGSAQGIGKPRLLSVGGPGPADRR